MSSRGTDCPFAARQCLEPLSFVEKFVLLISPFNELMTASAFQQNDTSLRCRASLKGLIFGDEPCCQDQGAHRKLLSMRGDHPLGKFRQLFEELIFAFGFIWRLVSGHDLSPDNIDKAFWLGSGQLFENVRGKRHDRRLPVACSECEMLTIGRPLQGADSASTGWFDDQFVGFSDAGDRHHAVAVTCRD